MWYWKVTFASYSLRKKSGQRRKVERGGEKRKRLPANPMILENAPWHFTVRFICKLTARQDRSLYNEQITGFVKFVFLFFFNYCQVKFKRYVAYLIWNLVKTSQRNDLSWTIHSTGYEFCRAAALRPVSKSSLQYMPLNFQWTKIIFSLQKVDKSFVHGGFSYCRVPVFWFTLILSQTISPFSPSDLPAVIPSKLVFTSLHCSISSWPLKGLRSDKPSNKHDSNRYQPKAYLIYNQRSDQTRSAARVNKTLIDVLIAI